MPTRAPIRASYTQGGSAIGSRAGSTSVKAYIRGGPELAKALARLEKGVRDELLVAVTKAGGEVLAKAWAENVRANIGTGPGVAHYAEAIESDAKPGKRGATGIVRLKAMPTAEGEDHPRAYAARFEYGSAYASKAAFASGTAGAGRVRHAVPTLRPAFDANQGRMVDAMAAEAKRLIEAAS